MLPTIADLINRMVRDQHYLGITLYAGASEEELLAFERKKGVRLPADIREFYRFCNGLGLEEETLRIIPLHEIMDNESRDSFTTPSNFHLAEWLAYCDVWTLSINPSKSNDYIIYNEWTAAVTLTNSFTDFLELILNQGFDGLYDRRELVVGQLLVNTCPKPAKLFYMEELNALAESVKQKLNLDYDAESVKFTEEFIERIKTQFAPEEWQGLINSLGAFVGRCIIVNYGGSWQHDDKSGICIAFDERNKVFPFNKVTKQFQNGLEDSIYSFYTIIPTIYNRPTLSAPPPVAPAPPPAPSPKPWYKFW